MNLTPSTHVQTYCYTYVTLKPLSTYFLNAINLAISYYKPILHQYLYQVELSHQVTNYTKSKIYYLCVCVYITI
jgi:hypothetical protein